MSASNSQTPHNTFTENTAMYRTSMLLASLAIIMTVVTTARFGFHLLPQSAEELVFDMAGITFSVLAYFVFRAEHRQLKQQQSSSCCQRPC